MWGMSVHTHKKNLHQVHTRSLSLSLSLMCMALQVVVDHTQTQLRDSMKGKKTERQDIL